MLRDVRKTSERIRFASATRTATVVVSGCNVTLNDRSAAGGRKTQNLKPMGPEDGLVMITRLPCQLFQLQRFQ